MRRSFVLILALLTLVLWQCSDNNSTEPETNTPVNHAPQFDAMQSQNVQADSTLEFEVLAADADGDSLTLGCTNLPANSEFVDNGDGSGDFTFMPTEAEIAVYQLRFVASDRKLSDTLTVQVTVLEGPNRMPEIDLPDTVSVRESDTLRFIVTATDPDGTTPSLVAINLPEHAAFDVLSGVGNFLFIPSFPQVGQIEVSFVAGDGELSDTATTVIIVVALPNHRPELTLIADTAVAQGDTLILTASTTDLDGTIPTLSADSLPQNAEFQDNGDGSGTLTFAPNFVQLGDYNVFVIADDGELADTVEVTLTVLDSPNQPPKIDNPGTQYAFVDDTLKVWITASDPDGTTPTFEAIESPDNSSFQDQGNGIGLLTMVPQMSQLGVHPVTISAGDGELADTAEFEIEVVLDTMSLSQDGPIPCAVGNYWTYERRQCYSIGGGMYSGCTYDTITYTITGFTVSEGRIWWHMNHTWPILKGTFAISGDTIFLPYYFNYVSYFVLRHGESQSDGCWQWNVHTIDSTGCDLFQGAESSDCLKFTNMCVPEIPLPSNNVVDAYLSYGNGFFGFFLWIDGDGNDLAWDILDLIDYHIREPE